MMERYCFLHKDYEPPTFRALDPWELQIEHICRSISMRTGLLLINLFIYLFIYL